jgi:hypothetical protein
MTEDDFWYGVYVALWCFALATVVRECAP